MKKRYIIEVIIVIIALVLPFINSDKTVEITVLKQAVEKNIDVSIMEIKDAKKIRKTYRISETEYIEYFSYGAISYMDVDEVTVFKQDDKGKRSVIMEKVNTYINNKIDAFKGYGTNQIKMLEEAILVEKGSYILCIITDNKELKKSVLECF